MTDKYHTSAKRRKLKERAIQYKGGKCILCGYNRCPSAFDFHHVNGLDKDFDISGRLVWTAELQKELDKCVLLCAMCHREVHDGWHPDLLNFKEEFADL